MYGVILNLYFWTEINLDAEKLETRIIDGLYGDFGDDRDACDG
jgi:hypothetical protein